MVRALIGMLLLAWSALAAGDDFRPAYLEIRELDNERYDVLWKVPSKGQAQRPAISVHFPATTEVLQEPRVITSDDARIERWQVRHAGGLVGQTIAVEGAGPGVTDVIARVERRDGSSRLERLPASNPQFQVQSPAGIGAVAWTYFVLGVEHILSGIDHLLFVLALLLLVRGARQIVITVTAFTLAHSVTLLAATLGWVHVPGPPVESIIALSIVFVAAEVLHGLQGRPGMTARAPWLVAFSFGLLHGFGFAGALAEVGLPQTAVPTALLMFNAGVEVGQLVFVAVMLLAGAVLARLKWFSRPSSMQSALIASAYGIGSIAAFWTVERVVSFWA